MRNIEEWLEMRWEVWRQQRVRHQSFTVAAAAAAAIVATAVTHVQNVWADNCDGKEWHEATRLALSYRSRVTWLLFSVVWLERHCAQPSCCGLNADGADGNGIATLRHRVLFIRINVATPRVVTPQTMFRYSLYILERVSPCNKTVQFSKLQHTCTVYATLCKQSVYTLCRWYFVISVHDYDSAIAWMWTPTR